MFSFHQNARAQLNKTVGSVADSLASVEYRGCDCPRKTKITNKVLSFFPTCIYLQYGTWTYTIMVTHTHAHTHARTHAHTHTHTHTHILQQHAIKIDTIHMTTQNSKFSQIQWISINPWFTLLAPRFYNFFMLNRTEHEIYPAHKC